MTLASLTTILMLIFMSNQFVRYLNRAANGQIPLTIIMKLMMLELPNLMSLLLPLGFYMALLIAYGRLYAENEMTVLQACGYGPSQLLKHSYIMAIVISLLVFVIVMWGNPIIAVERARLIKTSGIQTLIQTVIPGRFTAFGKGREIFYIESMNRAHTQANHLFIAREVKKDNIPQWNILWAEKAFAETDTSQEDFLILKNGHEYEGIPGKADYQVTDFAEYKARLPHPKMSVKQDTRTLKTGDLFPYLNPNINKATELQWRLSIPLMVLTLTLVAIPLSRVNPRSGKFAKILPAILLYIVYANFLFVARDWMMAGKLPVAIGMMWVHGIILLFGLMLVWWSRSKLA